MPMAMLIQQRQCLMMALPVFFYCIKVIKKKNTV